MRLIAVVLLLAFFWPFHHKQKPVSVSPITVIENASIPETACDKDNLGDFIFFGEDGVAGFSKDSCDAAYEDWRTTPTKFRPLSKA